MNSEITNIHSYANTTNNESSIVGTNWVDLQPQNDGDDGRKAEEGIASLFLHCLSSSIHMKAWH
jgi:hypothetical protein